jgi:putative FmdB family regulatory protein
MPTYDHVCKSCGHEWEDIYSINTDPPKICPKCNVEAAVRVISYATPGKVELAGADLKQSIEAGGKDLLQRSLTDERLLANLVGEQRYETSVKAREKQRNEAKRNMPIFRRK